MRIECGYMKKTVSQTPTVGIRRLKNELSRIMARVTKGQVITVTDRKRAIALLVPFRDDPGPGLLRELVRAGRISWAGGKPVGARRAATVRGPSVADAVTEDRR